MTTRGTTRGTTPADRVTRQRARTVAGVVFVAIGVTALLRLTLGDARGGETDGAGGRRAVAVFPFTVRGGGSVQLIGEGMPDLLATNLDGAPPIQAIDPRSSVAAAAGLEVDVTRGDALARGLGARYFVLGTVTQVAGDVELDGHSTRSGG